MDLGSLSIEGCSPAALPNADSWARARRTLAPRFPKQEIDLSTIQSQAIETPENLQSSGSDSAEFAISTPLITGLDSELIQATVPDQHHQLALASRTSTRFFCGHVSCIERNVGFKRRYDLKRHSQKHLSTGRLACPTEGCRRRFSRKDKLVDHLRSGHRNGATYVCPRQRCVFHAISLALLAVHLETRCYSDNDDHNRNIEEEAAKHASSLLRETCPISACKVRVEGGIWDQQQHLLEDHSSSERKTYDTELRTMGYNWEQCQIICPICEKLSKECDQFVLHLISNHLSTDWTHLTGMSISPAEHKRLLQVDMPLLGLILTKERSFSRWRCTSCGQSSRSGLGLEEHLIRFVLVAGSEIDRVREQILRFWPEFSESRVFDDVELTVRT